MRRSSTTRTNRFLAFAQFFAKQNRTTAASEGFAFNTLFPFLVVELSDIAALNFIDHSFQLRDILVLSRPTYPELELRIAWNQPMLTHHGTYIVGFSAASRHMTMAPERATMIRFEPVMRERGTDFGKMFARQPWNKPFDYELLDAFIEHQLTERQDITSFWRPKS